MLKTCFFAIEGDGHECIDRDFSYTHAAMTRNQQEGCNLTMAPQWTNGTSSWFPPLDLWPLLVYLFEVSNTRNKLKNPRFLQTVEEREAAAAAAVPARSALRTALAESPGSAPWTLMEGWSQHWSTTFWVTWSNSGKLWMVSFSWFCEIGELGVTFYGKLGTMINDTQEN